MPADKEYSEGARVERAAFRRYLRGLLKRKSDVMDKTHINLILTWVLERQKRYDKKPGGLGK